MGGVSKYRLVASFLCSPHPASTLLSRFRPSRSSPRAFQPHSGRAFWACGRGRYLNPFPHLLLRSDMGGGGSKGGAKPQTFRKSFLWSETVGAICAENLLSIVLIRA